MAKNWRRIGEFSVDEMSGPIKGKWYTLYQEVYDRLCKLSHPQGVTIEFGSFDEAKRAAVGLSKLFTKQHGKKAISTSVRLVGNKPTLLVWHGDNWGSWLPEAGKGPLVG